MRQFVIGYILLAGIPVAAQTIPGKDKEHTIRIGTGFKEIKDNYILSRSAEGNTLHAGYSFSSYAEAKKTVIAADWDKGSLSNSAAQVKTNDFNLRLSQGFLIVKSRDKRLNFFAGYSIHTSSSFISVSDKENKKYSWSSFSGISLYQSLVYTRERTRLSLDLHLPVVGLASRPEDVRYYHHTVNGVLYDSYSNLFFASWHNQQAVSASIDFSKALGRGIRVVAGGKYDYHHLEKAGKYSDNKIGLYAGLSLTP